MLLRRFTPATIVVWALVAAAVFGVVFVGLAAAGVGGLLAFVVPVWAILAAMGLVIPNAPALALSRHPDAAGTAAALLGAGQFGLGAAVAPLVGVLGNDELALAAGDDRGCGGRTVCAARGRCARLATTRMTVAVGLVADPA